ncbi:hypothetical protein NW762_009196 [Fusarium torreyae]|uniref:pectinesterase n=1 Tax=Fusarium torreyae TaxID=1237075 RepID=A0A9W8RVJ5_9HYPO|nr:hypothetical protein NW762_009196 [Fusarium torreyae]
MFVSSFVLASSFVAGAFAAARTEPPSGAIVVGEGGDFTSVQEAVDSISSPDSVIFIKPGTYEEQVLIADTVGALTIYGYTEDDQDYNKNLVIITHSLGADEAGSNDASGTLRAKNDNLKLYNVNVVNSRGKGVQAIALSAYGDQQGYYGCQFTGYQDTVLTSQGHHYFHGTYIEGAKDFIFGQQSIAWFESCTLGIVGKGYITANGRDSEENPSWYVINKSIVEAISANDGDTHLGRPWRDYSRVVFQNSELGAVVNPVGWTEWNTNNGEHVYYGEFGNTGGGAATDKRASFSQQLDKAVTIAEIFESTSWIDSDYVGGTESAPETDEPAAGSSTTNAPVEPVVAQPTTLQTLVRETQAPDDNTSMPEAGEVAATSAAAAPATGSSAPGSSADDCSGTADGFASLNGGTTGGSGGEVVVVSTQEDLEKYAGEEGKYVIKIKGTITITPKGKEVKVTSDKTIVGIGADAEINEGGFNLQNQRNVIFRNLKIGSTYVEGDEEGKTQDFDGIQMDTCENIWIDHVHLEHGGDGLIDSRKDTTFLTVSWTILRNHNKAFGIGWTDNVVSEMTIHHNYFDKTSQRNPSVDNVKHAHMYNNYLVGQTSYGHYARGSTEMRLENCYFEEVNNPITADEGAKLSESGSVFKSCKGTTAKSTGDVFDPKEFYEYTLDEAEDVPAVVQEGAGRQASICPA